MREHFARKILWLGPANNVRVAASDSTNKRVASAPPIEKRALLFCEAFLKKGQDGRFIGAEIA
jgi:hypothetical protein